jgi:hypothetical protein
MPNPNDKKYDLEERTARFGENVMDFVKLLERNEINRPLISQVIRYHLFSPRFSWKARTKMIRNSLQFELWI